MASSVVADSVGPLAYLRHDLFQGFSGERGAFHGFDEVVEVRAVVAAVMNLHCLCVDVRFEGIICVGQGVELQGRGLVVGKGKSGEHCGRY